MVKVGNVLDKSLGRMNDGVWVQIIIVEPWILGIDGQEEYVVGVDGIGVWWSWEVHEGSRQK